MELISEEATEKIVTDKNIGSLWDYFQKRFRRWLMVVDTFPMLTPTTIEMLTMGIFLLFFGYAVFLHQYFITMKYDRC